ncbi:hypothetical protein F0562_008372 [Nyssa sinensis]|uniref:Uncharacterized protein n=1 Tax=Nyssa sinensis TaxID=561372 RepID=A0A5J5A5N3_9ASTE|nr:hypothetical protein F0562_008372 [Nyssa sinensis]
MEEMRAKIYSLRTQKMELDSRVLEMQSTISSLKDEQRTIEVALEEKKNEIKLLQEKELEIDSNKENPQVISLTEILKQKEAEIEDLKHRLEYPVKVWSVSSDDPSNPSVNLTATRSIAWKDKSEATGIKEEDGDLHESTAGYGDSENSKRDGDGSGNESTNHPDEESSTRSEDRRENGVEFADRREMTRNQGEAKNITIATETIANNGGEVFKTRDEYSDVKGTDGKEHGISGNEQLEKLNSIGGQDQRLGVNSKGGMKLEIPDNSEIGAGHRARGKHGFASKMRGKRWRILAKNRRYENSRNSENNGDVSMRGRRFSKDALENEMSKRHGEQEKLDERRNQNTGLKMRYESGQENADGVGLQGGEEGKDSRKEVRETVVSTDVKLLEHQNLDRC